MPQIYDKPGFEREKPIICFEVKYDEWRFCIWCNHTDRLKAREWQAYSDQWEVSAAYVEAHLWLMGEDFCQDIWGCSLADYYEKEEKRRKGGYSSNFELDQARKCQGELYIEGVGYLSVMSYYYDLGALTDEEMEYFENQYSKEWFDP